MINNPNLFVVQLVFWIITAVTNWYSGSVAVANYRYCSGPCCG